MRHIPDKKILSAYIDGRLDVDLSGRIKSHIEDCRPCLERAAAFKLTKKLLGNLEAIEVSPGFDFEFNRRLNEAIVKSEEAWSLQGAAQRLLEDIRTSLAQPVPLLVRAVVIILILASVIGTPYYFAKAPLSITAVYGKAEIYSGKDKKWVLASKGLTLKKDDILRTDSDAYVDASASRQFTVRVKGDSEIKVISVLPRFRNGTVSYEVTKGEMLVDITKKNFDGSKFEVYTPQAIAKALGTSFAIDTSGTGEGSTTHLAVLNGAVQIESRRLLYAKVPNKVIVRGGEKTEVMYDQAPEPPSLLLEKEWKKLEEIYQIGKRPQVMLLISETESRVRELLRPCSIYIYDVEPRTISPRLEEAVAIIKEAIGEKSRKKHMDAIHKLEMIVEENIEAKYNPQLLLFIGSYYEYLSEHEAAISTFKKVAERYPDSQFASLAQCTIGIIYNEKLGEKARAGEIFKDIISKYPNSLEELEAKKALKRQKS